MIVEAAIDAVRDIVAGWRAHGETVALVPTMGFFHAGHLALMNEAAVRADRVVVSLFVNPTQFAGGEDLSVYPRDFASDRSQAEGAGVDLLFCPAEAAMYPDGHRTEVRVAGLSQILCGVDRPVHFTGVATIVVKLFNIVDPDVAVFGEKDYQQLRIVQRLALDLDFTVDVVGVPTVREDDGLAMSSRNAYLRDGERAAATVLYRALRVVADAAATAGGSTETAVLLDLARNVIEEEPQCSIDYLSIVDSTTLTPVDTVTGRCRVLGAIRVNGRVRLIDNLALPSAESDPLIQS